MPALIVGPGLDLIEGGHAAGLAAGTWTDRDALRRLKGGAKGDAEGDQGGIDRTFHPEMSAADRARYHHTWKKAVQRSFDWEE